MFCSSIEKSANQAASMIDNNKNFKKRPDN